MCACHVCVSPNACWGHLLQFGVFVVLSFSFILWLVTWWEPLSSWDICTCIFMYFSYSSFNRSLIFSPVPWHFMDWVTISRALFPVSMWNTVCKWMMMVVERGRRKDRICLSCFSFLVAGPLIPPLPSFLSLLCVRDLIHSQFTFVSYGNDTCLKLPLRISLDFEPLYYGQGCGWWCAHISAFVMILYALPMS